MPEVIQRLYAPAVQSHYWLSDGTLKAENYGSGLLQEVVTVDPERVRRIRPKDLFANATALNARTQVTNYSNCRVETRDSFTRSVYFGPCSTFSSGFDTSPVEDSGDFGLLDLKMRLRIKDQKVDLPVMVAEVGQTISMITGLATDITAAFSKLKRGHPIDAVRRLLSDPKTRSDRALANRWLEYSFGVVPTMSDIYGLAEASATRLHSGIHYHQATTARTKREHRWASGPAQNFAVNSIYKRLRCRYLVSSPELMELASFGITNPASFLWEKTAWSFAIDWAQNVGDFLAGLDALVGVSDLVVLRSWGQDINFEAEMPGYDVQGDTAKYGWKITRARLGATSDLSFGYPELKSPLDTQSLGTRFANATALLRQIVR